MTCPYVIVTRYIIQIELVFFLVSLLFISPAVASGISRNAGRAAIQSATDDQPEDRLSEGIGPQFDASGEKP
jgi:hypothetical protein